MIPLACHISVSYTLRTSKHAYNNLHNDIRDGILRIAPSECRSDEADDANSVNQPRIEDDSNNLLQSIRVRGNGQHSRSHNP